MANKKITDLTLVSSVLSSHSIPMDNGIQTYRLTASQMKDFILANGNVLLAMLDDDIFHGLTSVAADDADYFILNDSSDSNKTKKALVSSFARNVFSAISGATSISAAGTYKITGASAIITLPSAVGFSGKIKLLHKGTSLSQIYTINTTSSQTIDGIASGAYKLCTNGEVLEIESDGSNWTILNHYAMTPWSSYTPTFSAGLGTPTGVAMFWRRTGDTMQIKGSFVNGTVAGSIGTISLPSGPTIDTAKMSSTSLLTSFGRGWRLLAGSAATTAGGSDVDWPFVYNGTNNVVQPVRTLTSLAYVSENYNNMSSTGDKVNIELLTIPITDWQA